MAVNMRIVSLICCIALVTLNALSLYTPSSPFQPYLAGASVAYALALLVIVFVNRGKRSESEPPIAEVAEAAKPMPLPIAGNQAEAEIVSFLATLQGRGRLVDFLMEDVSAYSDEQVGAAVRDVQEQSRTSLQRYLKLQPVIDGVEGTFTKTEGALLFPVGFCLEPRTLSQRQAPAAWARPGNGATRSGSRRFPVCC